MTVDVAPRHQSSAVLKVVVSALLVSTSFAQAPILVGTNPSQPLSQLEESNLWQCVSMIQDVMMTGATQPGLTLEASELYETTNPGPYPFSHSAASDEANYEADYRLVHPFLPLEPLSATLAGMAEGSAKALYSEGSKNATTLTLETCCDGTLFGYALPFSQSESNEFGVVKLDERLRYYVGMSGKANQTETTWYTSCPYTSIPAGLRVNSNFPASASCRLQQHALFAFSLVAFLLL